MGTVDNIGGFTDNIFNAFHTARRIAWEVAQIPFNWWFSLPSWVHWSAFSMLCLFALVLSIIAWKKRDEWRYRYL